MGFLNSEDNLENKLETMKLKNQIEEQKLSISQKKMMEKELKKKYGRDWRNILKVGKDSDLMKQFANAGRSLGDITGKAK
jgi:hypothetical protein